MKSNFTLKLQLFTFIIFAGNACFFPFQAVYFSDRKLSYTEIGIAFAIGALTSMLIQPVWGYLSDKYINKRKTLFITITASLLLIPLFIKADGFTLVLLLNIMTNAFLCGIYPLLDAYTFDYIGNNRQLSYSHFRFAASAGYAVANLILGYIVNSYGINYAFMIYEFLAVAGLVLLFSMKFEGMRNVEKIQVGEVAGILKEPRLLVFFATTFLMNAAFIGGVNYMNELIRYTGGDVSNLGMVWFTTCTFEVITFTFANKLMNRFGVINVYRLSMLLFGCKLVLDFVLNKAVLIVAAQALEGVSFTLFIASSMEYLNTNARPQLRASMMSINAAFGGLGTFTASLLGGMLLNIVNASQLYGILSLVCFLSLTISLIFKVNSSSIADT